MPITFLDEGSIVKIKEITLSEILCKRIKSMGFNIGESIQIIKNDGANLILGVGEARIALSFGMAQKILAE
ncbi:MAG: FeoA family protein [Clostridium sp.]|uniref:FeoA family protein n=1 Tax=Clostridium sp. TaxID=1506 RepID=UPI003F3F04CF